MEAERPAPYRVTILPTVLEVSARLATSEELRGLVKLLRASAVIWGKTEPNEDCDRPSYEVPEEDLLTLRDLWRRLDSTASKPFLDEPPPVVTGLARAKFRLSVMCAASRSNA
jgi:hypothetical protein